MNYRPTVLCIAIWLCLSGFCAASEVTFSRDIAPILFAECATCHRPGEAAPFSLLTYDDARRRAGQIAEVTRTRFMPPWPPHGGHGKFVGARQLTDEQIATLDEWAAAGSPRGDEADMPAAPEFEHEWQLGEPDHVLESPTYELPAAGGDRFRNFVVPVDINETKWVKAIELRPTNPRATHHARLGIDTTGESVRRDAADPEPGYDGMAWGEDPEGQIITWVPGMSAQPGLAGSAWRLQPNVSLVLHTHLQPTGKREQTQFRIGIHFADGSPMVRPVILRVGSRDIDIPAGDSQFVIVDEFTLPVDIDVHSIFPHAHSLCREIRVDALRPAKLPSGNVRPLIWIEHFDENWHDNYRYVEPVRLPRGTKIVTRFTYDNTDQNVRNRHHPPERTVYGSNAADEMQDVYLQVTSVHSDRRAILVEEYEAAEQKSKLVGYRKTLEVHPDDPWSREGLAACYLALGEPEKSVDELETRLEMGPVEVHTIVMLSLSRLATGDMVGAERTANQAIGLDGQHPLAWFALGKAQGAQQKFDEADQSYRRAIELALTLTEAHLNLADIHLYHGRVDEAAAACAAALEAAPDSPNILLKLAELRTRQGRSDEGIQLLERAHDLAPYIHPPKVVQAVSFAESEELDRVRELLSEAHVEEPNHPVPLLFLGQLARFDGNLAGARRYLDAATTLPLPDNWPASHRKRFLVLLHSERLRLAQQLNDGSLVRRSVAKLITLEPESKKLRELQGQLDSANK